jgi:hypothetical protein
MALLWIDGFEGYGGTGGVAAALIYARGYTTVGGSPNIAIGRLYGYSLYCNISNGNTLITPILTTDSTLISGIAFQVGSGIGLQFYYNGVQGPNILITSTSLTTKLGGTTLDTNTSFTLSNPWYYIEMKCICHPTNGSIEVRINGTTITLITDINTQTGTEAYYNIVRVTGGSTARIDDFYICDGSGDTANDLLGVCKIAAIFPNSDTETIQWTPSTGTTHYNLVDENPANSTDYVSSGTQTQTDLYGYPSLTGDSTILGLQINTQVSVQSGSSVLIESPILSNGVTDVGDDIQTSGAGYVDIRRTSTVDPGTGEAWTVDTLAAAKIGLRVM